MDGSCISLAASVLMKALRTWRRASCKTASNLQCSFISMQPSKRFRICTVEHRSIGTPPDLDLMSRGITDNKNSSGFELSREWLQGQFRLYMDQVVRKRS